MADDVIQKVINDKDIKNGSSIVYVSRNGTYKSLDPDNLKTPSLEDIEDKYKDILDEY